MKRDENGQIVVGRPEGTSKNQLTHPKLMFIIIKMFNFVGRLGPNFELEPSSLV